MIFIVTGKQVPQSRCFPVTIIPADEFGAALLRRNVHVCYAAFHFSENLLLEDSYVSLDDIGAFFSREGDMLNFSFVAESTLN